MGYDAEPSQVEAAAAACAQAGITNAHFAVASAYRLPAGEAGFDLYFSHAMFEHLAQPDRALTEARRVLKPGGTLAIAASDWSLARFDPWTDDVAAAMRGHYALRREAGGDPFAGNKLVALVRTAGFERVTSQLVHRVDLTYEELANYVQVRLQLALEQEPRAGSCGKRTDDLPVSSAVGLLDWQVHVNKRDRVAVEHVAVVLDETVCLSEGEAAEVGCVHDGLDPSGAERSGCSELGLQVGRAIALAAVCRENSHDHCCDSVRLSRRPNGRVANQLVPDVGQS
jgi:SAM-dependent methyltransferase